MIFLSPPWGGPTYSISRVFDLYSMTPLDGVTVYKIAHSVCENLAFYLPRNTNIDHVTSLLGPGEMMEVEQQYLNKKLKTITAYFGDLVSSYY